MIDIPGYKIVRLLGKGGMAEVYLAIQKSFEREVALKVMDQSTAADRAYSERFLREARIVSRLMHPNIVTVYDVGVVEGHHFLSMEYVPGEDLKKARTRLTLVQRVDVIRDVARALAYAGRKGYVHRDVKPENIMLHEDDGRSVLMDFGIARPSDLGDGMTQTGTAIGTPHYMSPEQARGKAVDPRSDIYSLGVLLFLMLTGYVPFCADSAVAVGLKHVSDPIPRLPQQLQLFQRIVDRAMAKSPVNRYQTADELLAELDQIPRYSIESIEKELRQQAIEIGGVDSGAPTLMNPVSRPAAASPAGFVPKPPPQHEPVVVRSGNHSWAWLLALLIAGGIGYGVYQQQRLPAEQRLSAVTEVFRPQSAPSVDVSPLQEPVISEATSEPVQNTPQVEPVPETLPAMPEALSPPAINPGQMPDSAAATGTSEQALPQPGPSSLPEREQLLTHAQQLLHDLETQPQQVIEIANIYRSLIERNPIDIEAGQGLQALRALMVDRVEAALMRRDFEFARSQLVLAEQAFTAEAFVGKLQTLMQRIETQERVVALLSTAEDYLQKNWLTVPESTNAAAVFRQILELEPENAMALAGLEQIARRYQVIAQQHLDAGDHLAAAAAVEKGLAVKPDNAGVLAVKAQLERLADIHRLLARARRQAETGQILQPVGDNSLESWRRVLEIDPQHPEAQRQLAIVEGDLVSGVEIAIQSERWDEARAQIARALAYFPDNSELQELKWINEQAILDSTRPLISRLLVSDRVLNSIEGEQNPYLQSPQVLYIGFTYDRMQPPASIEARLYEGQPAVEIERQQLSLNDTGGLRFFSLQSNPAGFANGSYRLDLLHDGVVLASGSFEIVSAASVAPAPTEILSPIPIN